MRTGLNAKRPRGHRGNMRRGPGGHGRSQTFDSNGPDVKIRGTPSQIFEKYLTLARDANSSGDRIMAENYLQHAEHYHRVLSAANGSGQQARSFQPPQQSDSDSASQSDDNGQAEQPAEPQH